MTLFQITTVAGAYSAALNTAKDHDVKVPSVKRAKRPVFAGFSMPIVAFLAKRVA